MHTHMDALERRFDGTIPAHLRAQARQLDRAMVRREGDPKCEPAPVAKPKRRFPSADALIAAMARLMAERAAVDGACSERDLACAGFTEAERAKHGPAAQRRAAALVADRARR